MPLWYAGFHVVAILSNERADSVKASDVAGRCAARSSPPVCSMRASCLPRPTSCLGKHSSLRRYRRQLHFAMGLSSVTFANLVLMSGLLGIWSAWIATLRGVGARIETTVVAAHGPAVAGERGDSAAITLHRRNARARGSSCSGAYRQRRRHVLRLGLFAGQPRNLAACGDARRALASSSWVPSWLRPWPRMSSFPVLLKPAGSRPK